MLVTSAWQDMDEATRAADPHAGKTFDLVLHMAAQAIVRTSVEDPIGTFDTNVIGAFAASSSLPYLFAGDWNEDELGNGYEYLIKKFADDSGHTAAEFYTNRTVVHLMTQLLALEIPVVAALNGHALAGGVCRRGNRARLLVGG